MENCQTRHGTDAGLFAKKERQAMPSDSQSIMPSAEIAA
jgi:hypothetical protein